MIMEPPPRRDFTIGELLDDLEHSAKIPARQRTLKISTNIERVCSRAYEDGLSNTSLDRLIDIVTLPNELDQASINNLIRNLYPATKVPSSTVTRVVGSLGHGKSKPAYSSQTALLNWLAMVYDVLENSKFMSQLYAILFNLLDTSAIRPQLCHILSLVTRRKHVLPYRIQVMMELIRQVGNEPPLVGLMRVFKDYYPDIIVGHTVSGRASVFTHPNREWGQRLADIQAISFHRNQTGLQPEMPFRVNRSSTTGSHQNKSSVIPQVHTFSANESSVTLEEIEDVHDFVQKLERMEPPNQLVAVIGDPLLQRLLQLRPSDVYEKRIDNWLYAFFEDQLHNPEPSEVKILEMLQAIHRYASTTRILPEACLSYLKSMLPEWNGSFGRETILGLLSLLPLGPFEELHSQIFLLIEDALLDANTIECKLALLKFYANLLNSWTVSLRSTPQLSQAAAPAITDLVNHANCLATVIIQDSPDLAAISRVLNFYEVIGTLISQPSILEKIRIPVPPSELIYIFHFSNSLDILNRLCGLLSLYKTAFETGRALNPKQYSQDYVNHFNGFLMDVCNCVWRSRAFNTTDPNALGCLLYEKSTAQLEEYVKSFGTSITLPSLFSLSFSPVLCVLSISYVRELEDAAENMIKVRHPGPVTQTSLKQLERDGGLSLSWQDYRLGVLMELEQKGIKGIGELMYNTMKALKTERENRA